MAVLAAGYGGLWLVVSRRSLACRARHGNPAGADKNKAAARKPTMNKKEGRETGTVKRP